MPYSRQMTESTVQQDAINAINIFPVANFFCVSDIAICLFYVRQNRQSKGKSIVRVPDNGFQSQLVSDSDHGWYYETSALAYHTAPIFKEDAERDSHTSMSSPINPHSAHTATRRTTAVIRSRHISSIIALERGM